MFEEQFVPAWKKAHPILTCLSRKLGSTLRMELKLLFLNVVELLWQFCVWRCIDVKKLLHFCNFYHFSFVLQDQNPTPTVPRVPVSVPGPGVGAQAPNVSMAGNHSNSAYQQQAAVMKQHQMLMDQQKQREQQQKHLLLEQQKQQFLMEQRQQHLLAEQVRGASYLFFSLCCFALVHEIAFDVLESENS